VAVIGSATDLYLELEVDEYDIRRSKPGQHGMSPFDSYAEQCFEAEVTRIIPLMDERSRTFRVEANSHTATARFSRTSRRKRALFCA
jgi:HlyD family secretion protein